MPTQHDRLTALFASRTTHRHAGDEAAVLKAASAFDIAIKTGRLSDVKLATIVAAASHPRVLQSSHTVGLLGTLANRHKIAGEAIVAMSRNNASHVRLAAMACLTRDVPVEICDTVLSAGLSDKLPKVRCKAAAVAAELDDKHHLAGIKRAIKLEPDRPTRLSLQFSYDLLRDGYQARGERNGYVTVVVKMPVGTVDHTVTSREFTLRGPREIAAEIRSGVKPAAAGRATFAENSGSTDSPVSVSDSFNRVIVPSARWIMIVRNSGYTTQTSGIWAER